jgi:hypothetical protein
VDGDQLDDSVYHLLMGMMLTLNRGKMSCVAFWAVLSERIAEEMG